MLEYRPGTVGQSCLGSGAPASDCSADKQLVHLPEACKPPGDCAAAVSLACRHHGCACSHLHTSPALVPAAHCTATLGPPPPGGHPQPVTHSPPAAASHPPSPSSCILQKHRICETHCVAPTVDIGEAQLARFCQQVRVACLHTSPGPADTAAGWIAHGKQQWLSPPVFCSAARVAGCPSAFRRRQVHSQAQAARSGPGLQLVWGPFFFSLAEAVHVARAPLMIRTPPPPYHDYKDDSGMHGKLTTRLPGPVNRPPCCPLPAAVRPHARRARV